MSAAPESSSEENPEHLLVLDDEKSIRWVLERTLTQSGYRVHLATDASEAHHLLNQYPIRLALVDINLPDQDGISFTQNVSTQFLCDRSPWSDVRRDAYYYNAARTLTSRGILDVRNAVRGEFGPDDPVHGSDVLLSLRLLKDELKSYVRGS
ncbi:MAG: response regulator [SAR324 cluster bacterium]|nr:response regulator [SAR324 cluster bacterium]